ncbi:MAG: hypothetical protein ACC660_07530, partial [Acidimicrobiales bacterium]
MVALSAPGEDLTPHPRGWRNATITYAGGLTASLRFIKSKDTGFRSPRRVRLDGELGTSVDNEVRTIDRMTGNVITGRICRDEDGAGDHTRLRALELDVGNAGRVRWENPFAEHAFTDEQIALTSHLLSVADAALQRGRPLYGPDDAFQDVDIMQAIHRSAERGRTVS